MVRMDRAGVLVHHPEDKARSDRARQGTCRTSGRVHRFNVPFIHITGGPLSGAEELELKHVLARRALKRVLAERSGHRVPLRVR